MDNSNWLTEFGFSKNPYDTKALAFEDGDKLLVGRDREVCWLTDQLTAGSRIPLLIGDNGVGKSSIANVVAYRMSKEPNVKNHIFSGLFKYFIKPPQTRYFVLELNRISNTQSENLEEFEKSVYLEALYSLLNEKHFLRQRGIKAKQIREINLLLRKMTLNDTGGGLQLSMAGVSLSHSASPNPSAEPYLIRIAQEWLRKCFSTPYGGGMICLIDNLENHGTSQQVQKFLDKLRDTLFQTTGLLWILCGTLFAVEGSLASSRLSSRLASRKIQPVEKRFASILIKRRIAYYGKVNADPPVDQDLFEFLYAVVKSQLRMALSLCEEFAVHLHEYPERCQNDRKHELQLWLNQKAAGLPEGEYEVPENSWSFFDFLTKLGRDMSSVNSRIFHNFNETELDHISSVLIKKGLIERIEIDSGFLLRVTKDGWLVSYKRNGYCVER